MKIIMWFLIAMVFSVSIAYADISYSSGSWNNGSMEKVPIIRISGSIKSGDSKQFHLMAEAAIASLRSNGIGVKGINIPLRIQLDSIGGSVSEALAIGSEIRNIRAFSVNVPKSASCVSSCVFILAGGVIRSVSGKVGIHRPYLGDDLAFTADKQKENYIVLEKNIKEYLSGMNVPTTLYDTMFRIPPEKVRYLTERELQDYNLNEDDPFYKEAFDAAEANKVGFSKSEYLRKKSECMNSPNNDGVSKCLRELYQYSE